jgi:dipeptidyl aminopeptidase/acylaminoacyl peptidase
MHIKTDQARLFLLSILLLAAAGTAQEQSVDTNGLGVLIEQANGDQRAKQLPVADFLHKPQIITASLSPLGKTIVIVKREIRGASLWEYNIEGKQPKKLLGRKNVDAIWWSFDGKYLFIRTDDTLSYHDRSTSKTHTFYRLEKDRDQRILTRKKIMSDSLIIMEELPSDEGFRMIKVKLDGSEHEVVRTDWPIYDYLFDSNDDLAFIQTAEGSQKVIYQVIDNGAQELFLKAIVHCEIFDPCAIMSFDSKAQRLYLKTFQLSDRSHIASLDLHNHQWQVLHDDPEAISEAFDTYIDDDNQPALVSYNTDRHRYYGLTTQYQSHLNSIYQLIGNVNIHIKSASLTQPWLLRVYSDNQQHGLFWFYYPGTGQMKRLFNDSGDLGTAVSSRKVSKKHFIRYTASDGMTLYAFLSLPKGVPLTHVPLITKVHGGPWSQVTPGYDSFTQLLVNRGYAVIEPNFRSSTGYGKRYVFNSNLDFGNGRVHQDIVDATRFVLSQGIGDANKSIIIGHSFGGFSALNGVTFSPTDYIAGFAGAPPTDIYKNFSSILKRDKQKNGFHMDAWFKAFGSDITSVTLPKWLSTQSPDKYIDQVKRPLLIWAGGLDNLVRSTEVKRYALDLRRQRKSITLIVDEEQGHNPKSEIAQKAYLTAVDRFIASQVGVVLEVGVPDSVRLYLDNNIVFGDIK